MNDHVPTGQLARWVGRLSPSARGVAIVLGGVFLVFLAGGITGFTAAMIDHDERPKLLAVAILGVSLIAFVATALLLWSLVRSLSLTTLSRYDRRYYGMWGAIALCGIPVGAGIAFLGDREEAGGYLEIIGSGPLEPMTALASAGLLIGLLVLAAWIYHRTIDDHEEQAYLWGSTIAFYFLTIALPAAWLLARGGWFELGFAQVAALLLASIIVQFAVWLWFKFR
jgi:hypothetical protein